MTALGKKLARVQLSEEATLLVLAVAVGAAIGLSIVVFRVVFDLAARWVYNDSAHSVASRLPWRVIIAVPLGGLMVGSLLQYVIGKEKHPGVSMVMESVALTGGRLNYQLVPAKIAAAIISIAYGASVGPEDPAVQIGAGNGSAARQWLKLSDDRVRLLTAAGTGAGIAAVFNAPIAGMFFALEIIMAGEFTTGAFSIVVLASVVAAIISQIFLGYSRLLSYRPMICAIRSS
jgi:chloride channel protein, CIC family